MRLKVEIPLVLCKHQGEAKALAVSGCDGFL